MKLTLTTITAAGLFSVAVPPPAAAQGIGCEVILCLAGGFPGAACSPAKRYFMNSRRKRNGYNPFKPCKQSGKGDYSVPTNWFRRTRTECPGGYAFHDQRDGGGRYCISGYRRFADSGVKISIPDTDKSYEYIYRTYEIRENSR